MPMSEADQFWQFAKEATLSAFYAQNGKDRQDLLELARIWTQAALQGELPGAIAHFGSLPIDAISKIAAARLHKTAHFWRN
jgi:hypothetical protein